MNDDIATQSDFIIKRPRGGKLRAPETPEEIKASDARQAAHTKVMEREAEAQARKKQAMQKRDEADAAAVGLGPRRSAYAVEAERAKKKGKHKVKPLEESDAD